MIFAQTMGSAIFTIFHSLIGIYSFIVIARGILSWFSPSPFNPLVRAIYGLTDPLLWRIRKYLPFTFTNGLDFSPIVLLIGLFLLREFIRGLSMQFFHMM